MGTPMILLCAALALAALPAPAPAEPNYCIKPGDIKILTENENFIKVLDTSLEFSKSGAVVIAGEAEMLADLPADALLCVDGYQKQGQTYGRGAINLPCSNLCGLIRNDTCVYPSVQGASEGSLPAAGCPIEKGAKIIKDLVLTLPCMPNNIQGSEDWCFVITLKAPNSTVYYAVNQCISFSKTAKNNGEC